MGDPERGNKRNSFGQAKKVGRSVRLKKRHEKSATMFEWPSDVEGCIFNFIRTHVRCGLKKRTWGSLHDELLRAVDERALKRFYESSCCGRYYVYLQEAYRA